MKNILYVCMLCDFIVGVLGFTLFVNASEIENYSSEETFNDIDTPIVNDTGVIPDVPARDFYPTEETTTEDSVIITSLESEGLSSVVEYSDTPDFHFGFISPLEIDESGVYTFYSRLWNLFLLYFGFEIIKFLDSKFSMIFKRIKDVRR